MQRIEMMQIKDLPETVVHPGDLPLGELAAGDDALFDGCCVVAVAIQVLPDCQRRDADGL